uniref:Hexose transporter n=1 Tax=Colletotrichum graminicola TaxID=31870 RepID=E7AIN1_COLGR|nr:hexose transporter [Colletotrichum graminicola]
MADQNTAAAAAEPNMSEKQEKREQPSDSGSRTPSPVDRRRVADEKPKSKGFLARMGDLPEWGFRGQRLQGKVLNWSIGFIASCGFLMFGYDQGVLGSLLTLDDFQRSITLMTPLEQSNSLCWLDFPENTQRDYSQCTGDPNTQAAAVAVYQIGCFLGAVLILFYGESWGRKSSTFWGSAIMIFGTILQASAHEYGLFSAGRIVGGIGNGMVTSSKSTLLFPHGNLSVHDRIREVSSSPFPEPSSAAVSPLLTGYGFYFLEGSIRWRFPVSFQSFFTIIVMIGLLYLPDSPRWLAMKGRMEEAREVTSRLLGKPIDHEDVTIEVKAIQEALEAQSQGGSFKFKELLTNGPSQNLRRTLLGIFAQFFQQICGINLITYYSGFLFENSLGFGPELSRLLAALNGTEYFLASLVALPLIERTGRRKLMLFGAFGMMASMAILAGTVSTGTVDETGAPKLESVYGITATVFLFVFNSFFAIGWLGMTWLYPAEITNLRIRIQANALSTCSNWLSNFLIVMITPPAFANLGYRTYVMFAVFNAVIIPCVYFFFPEPKGRSLEELDVIFASAHADKVNPVKRAKEMRKVEGRELENELDKYFGSSEMVEDARPMMQ